MQESKFKNDSYVNFSTKIVRGWHELIGDIFQWQQTWHFLVKYFNLCVCLNSHFVWHQKQTCWAWWMLQEQDLEPHVWHHYKDSWQLELQYLKKIKKQVIFITKMNNFQKASTCLFMPKRLGTGLAGCQSFMLDIYCTEGCKGQQVKVLDESSKWSSHSHKCHLDSNIYWVILYSIPWYIGSSPSSQEVMSSCWLAGRWSR